ncbi:MAG: LarC family nickel insertion protein, partial [SAR202 cluster bacterium]|nr:LarC family nickel insertion protein [SAR202 cluster bacterium]
MRAAFFNCVGGASGDMILGAMVDAGLPMDRLARELKKLNVEGFSISVEPAKRGGVDGTHVTVHIAESAPRQKHWRDFVKMVDGSSLSASLKQKAVRVFERLGKAEAAVHKGPVDSVHLHELASLDTLVDVCGAVVGMELLGVGSVYASPLPAGSGVFTIEHGVMPGLSPATAALVADAKAPLGPPPAGVADSGETVTPTGAAILTTLATFSQPVMRVERVGYGL